MYILALETTGAHASVAVINEEGKVFEKSSDAVLNHLQHLMPMTQELLEEAGLQLGDMTAIAASQGPGSFTGIRIGVSSARALAQVTGKETVAVPTLKAFAYNMPEFEGLICPVFDARRSQVFAGAYKWNGGKIEEVIEGAAYSLDEFLEKTAETGLPRMFFGDGIKAYQDRFAEDETAPESVRFQMASSAAKLAKDMYEEGLAVHYEELMPEYMRKAEAERKLEEKSKK